ncbi:MAG: serine hydrolase domain-containing protein [Myxococcota bacterium]
MSDAAEPRAQIQGTCDPRFERVREAFAENFRERDEVGASVSLFLDGECVVDLWGGFADQKRTRPWTRDTVANVYSTTKGMTALCALMLVERGELDLDRPVAEYWPEFAAAGKEAVPVRWLLSHRAGLPAVGPLLPPEALFDWDAMAEALAGQAPWWDPGEAHGYHAVTYGWLVGEVVRRITGRSVGTFFREEVAGPLDADFHIGLPDAEHDRAAEMSAMAAPPSDREGVNLMEAFLKDPEGMLARAFMNPPSMAMGPNHADWRRAEIPAANGHGNARSVARVYGALAAGRGPGGAPLLGADTLEQAVEEQSNGLDSVLQIDTRIGLGFMLPQERKEARFGPGGRSFGHPGAGGSVGCGDPDAGLGFGYVMNRMGPHILLDPRAVALIEAAYDSLD